MKSSGMRKFLQLADSIGLVVLDIGARRGSIKDLGELAPAVSYYGFEPDALECERLNATVELEKWKFTRYLPMAVGSQQSELMLRLYRQRGCSSAFEADQALAKLFLRDDDYTLDAIVQVPTKSLDQIVSEEAIDAPAFMKIDVQGMEVECFQGATETLRESLVGIRTEVSFLPIYKDQPLFAEVDQALRGHNFVPMRWLESHDWRRLSTKKYPQLAETEVPYSRGQLIHADILYLLHPEALEVESDVDIRRFARLGLVALAYEFYDYAYVVFSRPSVLEYIQEFHRFDPISELQALSQKRANQLSKVLQRWARTALNKTYRYLR